MPLYSYRKAPAKITDNREIYSRSSNLPQQKSTFNITLGEILIGLYNDFHRLMTTSRIAALFIPTMLVISGVYIIYRQVWPQVFQMIEASSGYFDDNTTALVAGDYITIKQQYSNPGAKYFSELKTRAEERNLLFQDETSKNYKNNFSLSIPSLELFDLKVTPNTDSSVETVYDQVLTDGLAHFEGTGLPITDKDTYNSVIYGHSSAGDYYERTKDPAAAFSRLSKIRYGEEIIVKMDGKEYKYKFIKGKIVDANDLSVLEGQTGQQYLTLFTCYPNGNNGKRFVATARLIE
jgi:LPXTG-site transpeptidase (sortase) family protein